MKTDYSIATVRNDSVQSGSLIVYWLGGAGFAFKFASGEVVCIDPYLSDAVERMFGFRRLSLAPVKAEYLRFDYLLLTHDHADHLDPDCIDAIVAGNPECRVIAPKCCAECLRSKRIPFEDASPGTSYKLKGLEVEVVDADHGDGCPTAVGFVLKFGDHNLYFTGDTAYTETMMAPVIASAPDIVIPCINGAFGNLNEDEAAALVAACKARIAIPSHFWLFAEHGGSPGEFRDRVAARSPETEVVMLTPGREYEI